MSEPESPGFAQRWRSYAHLPLLQRLSHRAGLLLALVLAIAVLVLIVRGCGALILAVWRATSWS